MGIDHLVPFSGTRPPLGTDPRDPRAASLIQAHADGPLPRYGLVGAPYDGTVAGRKGAFAGPSAIRDAFRYSGTYHWEQDASLDTFPAADVGDIDCSGGEPEEVLSRVATVLKQLRQAGCEPLLVGGDNSLTYASVKALAESVPGRVGLLSFDAHLDVRVAEPRILNGSPNYLILDRVPQVVPENLVVFGVRRFSNSRHYRTWAREKGMGVVSMQDVRRRGFHRVFDEAASALLERVDALYVSLDIDAIDQAWAPGVSSPSPDGLTPREVFDAVERLGASPKVAGFEVVECAPPLDPTGNTARVAALACLHHWVGRSRLPKA